MHFLIVDLFHFQTPPENIDPFAIYVGNIPDNINIKYIKSQFDQCIHYEEYDIQFNNDDSPIEKYSRYANFYFSSVEEAIEAYKKAFSLDLGRRRIVRFRQRNMDLSDPYKDYKHAQHADGCLPPHPSDSVISKPNLTPLWTDSNVQTDELVNAPCNCKRPASPSSIAETITTISSTAEQRSASSSDPIASAGGINIKTEIDRQNELQTFDHLDDLLPGENDSVQPSPSKYIYSLQLWENIYIFYINLFYFCNQPPQALIIGIRVLWIPAKIR